MDAETRQAFTDLSFQLEGTERLLQSKISDGHEAVIQRLRTLEILLSTMSNSMTLTVNLLTDFGRRITDLEKKG